MAYGARPVPQNIMSVEFKIFDFMTLKQFGISVGLLLVCFALFFVLPSPYGIVIDLFIVVIGGIVVFVPFNGEPFQEFLSSYMEAMISPQRRVWHKKGIIVKSAAEKARFYRYGNDPVPESENQFKFADQKNIKITQEQNQLDNAEQKFLQTNEPIPNMPQIKQQNQNPSGTNISQSSIKNSVNINKFNQQKPQQNNSQVSQAQHTNIQSNQTPTQPTNNIANQNQQSNNQQNVQPNPFIPQNNNTQTTPQTSTPSQSVTGQQPTFLKKEEKTPDQTQPQKQSPSNLEIDDETAVKNFIFGSVSNYDDDPVKGAAVILKDESGSKNIEVLNTNDAGEFKTSYEYKAGKYMLYVNVDGKDFNQVIIENDPIDPIPFEVKPKDYEDKRKQMQKAEEEERMPTDVSDDGVFEGAYDASVFNLGTDYLDEATQQTLTQVQPVQQIETQTQTPPPIVTTSLPSTSQPIEASGANTYHAAYLDQANNMFDQMMSGRTLNDYAPEQTTQTQGNTTTSSQVQQTPATSPQSTSTQQTQTTPNPAVNNDVEVVYYDDMTNANVPFENNLVTLPNTMNGILVGPNGAGLDNTQIRIYDQNNNLITSMNSDQTGRFYSYSPLPNGTYTAYLSKNNQNLVGFKINMDGSVIPPKYISFSY